MFNFDDDDKKIEFSYSDDDFTPEGRLDFSLLPEYKVKYDRQGYLIEDEKYKEYKAVIDRNEKLKKISRYQKKEELWENMDRLSPNQQKALTLMVSGVNINQIATECNIERSTIYRWLQLDIFTKTLKLWQKQLFIEADTKLNNLVSKALDRLEYILDNPSKFDGKDYLRSIELCLGFMKRNEEKL
ncbi:helix-turn-helix domain-containing protein [Geminocystis sp. NIES-3709]|uniref:helix-turn-helix domain-containing protein n=1 Tax=Geminocystis sp. NIES-3709 TaxID=1617448 RepID=UPI0005FC67DD|nr:helix-turn-helix domain-containing protein [Geminocystis sp. NIES-3709]BAQ64598.1 hypothetical protein GM3709_1363 [Geminocystis sp. NIES-3709]